MRVCNLRYIELPKYTLKIPEIIFHQKYFKLIRECLLWFALRGPRTYSAYGKWLLRKWTWFAQPLIVSLLGCILKINWKNQSDLDILLVYKYFKINAIFNVLATTCLMLKAFSDDNLCESLPQKLSHILSSRNDCSKLYCFKKIPNAFFDFIVIKQAIFHIESSFCSLRSVATNIFATMHIATVYYDSCGTYCRLYTDIVAEMKCFLTHNVKKN